MIPYLQTISNVILKVKKQVDKWCPFKEHDVATAYIFSLDYKKILLVKKRFSGRLMPPGGHVTGNEPYLQTVLRETSEESNIDTALLKTKKFGDGYYSLSDNCLIFPPQQDEEFIVKERISSHHYHMDHIYCFQYPVIFDSYGIYNMEIARVMWVKVEEINKSNFYPNVFYTIKYFYSKGLHEQKNKAQELD